MTTVSNPELRHTQVNGVPLASFEWHAPLKGREPTLWMVHATGFHARVWDQLIHRLAPRHVIATEQRGHGRSGGNDFSTWADFGRDQAMLAAALDVQGAVGIGHSMGAHALVHAAALEPSRFRQLILIDPVILSPAQYHVAPPPPGTLHPAAGRKNRFESAQAMFDRFVDRPPYSIFDRNALMDYCQHGLRPDADGSGFELACAPAFEGKIYPQATQNPGIYASIRALQIPVLVIRARPQDPTIKPWDPLGTPTWGHVAQEFRHGRDLQLMDKTHLLPMEDPGLTAELIEQAMQRAD